MSAAILARLLNCVRCNDTRVPQIVREQDPSLFSVWMLWYGKSDLAEPRGMVDYWLTRSTMESLGIICKQNGQGGGEDVLNIRV